MFHLLLQNLFWSRKGMPVVSVYRQFQSLQWSNQCEYEERLNRKLYSLLHHALSTVPYYKDYTNYINLTDLEKDPVKSISKLPVLEKHHIKKHLTSISNDIGSGWIKNSTGGSTGEPVVFIQDNKFKTDAISTTYLFYEWANRTPEDKLVKLWGAERDLLTGKYGFKQKLSDFIDNRITLNSFRMSRSRMLDYYNIIKHEKNCTVEGYAEALYEFSNFIHTNDLKIDNVNSVISSAGTLFQHMRDKIETVFMCQVYDRYGSREAGNMAAECDHHEGLHVFGETTYIEVVDAQGNLVKPGEEGEILVTNLSNYTMPLIRYRIGDRAILGDSTCGCGRPYPLLKKIVGRSSSSFKTSDGGVVSPEFFIHTVGVMLNEGEIEKFQIIQESLDEITVFLILSNEYKSVEWEKTDKLIEIFKKVMGDSCRIQVKLVNHIDKTITGKHLYTISKVS